MASSIVSQVMEFLTPDLIGRIAAALGLDRTRAQSAIGAAVPGLLAALSGLADRPAGAQKLADAARRQSAGLAGVELGDISGMLTSGNQASLVSKGSQMVSSLLGTRDEAALTEAVGRFADLDRATSSSLIGALAPIVVGSLGRQANGDLSSGSVARVLAGQKDSIAAALPSDFRNLLAGSGVLESVVGSARGAASAASSGVAAAGERAATKAASSSRNWAFWLIPLAVLIALLVYLMRPAEQVAEQAAEEVTAGAQSLVVDGADVGKQVTDSIGSLTTALSNVKDAATAQAELPKLQEITTQIDAIGGQVGKFSAEQKAVLSGLVSQALPALNELIEKVLAIPGVAAVLEEPLKPLQAKVAALAA
jgi:hypothetical protein